ncbi:hypothetical protein GCM10017772_41170 [Promicromonospora soli]|uniref:HTH cro/C1-type domain-containing protein n=1 Tax=Promicromonospora soli TaxID=2035533 RepID=A0A919G6M8_9MICO|nr:hypothetical protein GCM10017772_41170 [Promicromonospora soli]
MPDLRSDGSVDLRRLRLRAMLTQEELANKAGVGTRTIRDIEAGKARPQPKTLRLLLDALGLAGDDRAPLGSFPDSNLPVPRELPRTPAVFVGRERQVDGIFAHGEPHVPQQQDGSHVPDRATDLRHLPGWQHYCRLRALITGLGT